MSIKVRLAEAHKDQLAMPAVKHELEQVQTGLDQADLEYQDDTVNFIFFTGRYNHEEKFMTTVCAFVNKIDRPISELAGEIRMQFVDHEEADIAVARLEFDEPFMGILEPDEAVLVHINIPVRGLTEDKVFNIADMRGRFDNVRVTYADEDEIVPEDEE